MRNCCFPPCGSSTEVESSVDIHSKNRTTKLDFGFWCAPEPSSCTNIPLIRLFISKQAFNLPIWQGENPHALVVTVSTLVLSDVAAVVVEFTL